MTLTYLCSITKVKEALHNAVLVLHMYLGNKRNVV